MYKCSALFIQHLGHFGYGFLKKKTCTVWPERHQLRILHMPCSRKSWPAAFNCSFKRDLVWGWSALLGRIPYLSREFPFSFSSRQILWPCCCFFLILISTSHLPPIEISLSSPKISLSSTSMMSPESDNESTAPLSMGNVHVNEVMTALSNNDCK